MDDDIKFVQKLRAANQIEQDKMFVELYERYYPFIEQMIFKNTGNQDDAEDVFQDSLVVFYQQIIINQKPLTATIKTYLYAVAYRIWMKKIRDRKTTVETSEELLGAQIDENIYEKELQFSKLSKNIEVLVNNMGNDCKKILYFFYYERLSMIAIAELMDYKNAQISKNKKSKCLKRLRKLAQTEGLQLD